MNLSVQVKDARGRKVWELDGRTVSQPVDGAKPLELRHIVADALGQDKDGPFKPRTLSAVLGELAESGNIADTLDGEFLAWVDKTVQLTPLIKARILEIKG